MGLHRADDAKMHLGQASLFHREHRRPTWSFHPCRTLVFLRSHARFVVVVLGVGLADGLESPWRVGLTDGIESPTVILRVF